MADNAASGAGAGRSGRGARAEEETSGSLDITSGEIPTNVIMGGVAVIVLFLVVMCIGLYILLSMVGGVPFSDVMFGAATPTP